MRRRAPREARREFFGHSCPYCSGACRRPRIRRHHGTSKERTSMNTHGRPWTLAILVTVLAVIVACGGDASVTDPEVAPPPPAPVLLKEVVIDRLPSPFYHFDYDGGGR